MCVCVATCWLVKEENEINLFFLYQVFRYQTFEGGAGQ